MVLVSQRCETQPETNANVRWDRCPKAFATRGSASNKQIIGTRIIGGKCSGSRRHEKATVTADSRCYTRRFDAKPFRGTPAAGL